MPQEHPTGTHRPGPEILTPREREVLGLLADGMTNQAIADTLTISPATLTRHISNLLAKTSCTNRAQLVRYATDHGLTA